MTDQTHHTTIGEVRVVALSRITPSEDFNPRSARDPQRFAQLVASVKADGVLAPLLVTPDGDGDCLRLIAGEGRWLAAGEAGQTEVPVHIVAVDDRTGGLELAMAENLARQDLDPVQEAQGYERLRAAGLTKKGISERLGVAQKRVTERLELLKLPPQLHPQIASGQIPPAAIKALVALERIHRGLAACAVARIDAVPAQSWEEPLTWADLVADPVGVLVTATDGPGTELPGGVYDFADAIAVGRFALSDPTREQLGELCELIGQPPEEFVVRFGREALERATALKAAYATKSGWAHVLVGQDVANELAGDYVAACLSNQRRIAEQSAKTGGGQQAATAGTEPGVSEDEIREQRRAERAEQDREREHAVSHNAELGSAILRHLPRLKVDADVLKVLTVIDVAGDLDGIAARGARRAVRVPGLADRDDAEERQGQGRVPRQDRGRNEGAGVPRGCRVAFGDRRAAVLPDRRGPLRRRARRRAVQPLDELAHGPLGAALQRAGDRPHRRRLRRQAARPPHARGPPGPRRAARGGGRARSDRQRGSGAPRSGRRTRRGPVG